MPVSASSASTLTPRRSAASAMASFIPTDRLNAVVLVLHQTRRSPSDTKQSVNVPPMSMSMAALISWPPSRALRWLREACPRRRETADAAFGPAPAAPMSRAELTADASWRRLPRGRCVSGLQGVDVQLDVVAQGMAGRQVLDLDEHRARRAVELDDPAPVPVRREAVPAAGHQRRVHLGRVAGRDQAALLVGVAGVAQVGPAPVAPPALRRQIEVDVLGDAARGLHGSLHPIVRRRAPGPPCRTDRSGSPSRL